MLAMVRTLQAEEFAGLVECELRFADMVAAMGVGDEALAALAHPLHRPLDLARPPR